MLTLQVLVFLILISEVLHHETPQDVLKSFAQTVLPHCVDESQTQLRNSHARRHPALDHALLPSCNRLAVDGDGQER